MIRAYIEKTGQTVHGYIEHNKIVRSPHSFTFGGRGRYILKFIPYERIEPFEGISKVRVSGGLEFEAYRGVNSLIGVNGFVMYEEK